MLAEPRAHGGGAGDATSTGLATLGGAAFALAPLAGAISLVLALVVLAVGRVAGRDARDLAGVVGFGTFPALFLVAAQDLARLGARARAVSRRARPVGHARRPVTARTGDRRRARQIGRRGAVRGVAGRGPGTLVTLDPAAARRATLDGARRCSACRRCPCSAVAIPGGRRTDLPPVAQRRTQRAMSSAAFAAAVAAIGATAFAWSIELGVAAMIGIHAALPFG